MDREQSIALWLARKMGLSVYASTDIRWAGRLIRNGDPQNMWCPQNSRHQCMEVIEWAAMNGIFCYQAMNSCEAGEDAGRAYVILHNRTTFGIRAAQMEAIARATGWKGSSDAAILDAPQEPKP